MTSTKPESNAIDSSTTGVRDSDELSVLIDDLVKLSTLPSTAEHLERLAYSLSSKTSSALQQNMRVDANIGTTTDSKVTNQLSAISFYNNQNLAVAYLRAASHQLRCEASTNVAVAAGGPTAPSYAFNSIILDCSRLILPVVSNCVVQCLPQRSIIKETGILEALWILVEKDGKKTLSVSSCEFLQACIYAKEYHYAYQQISDTWPLPTKDYLAKVGNTTPSVEILLRYYYLRGVICMGCEPIYHPLAIRCFWTCLIVPVASDANAVSAIAVAAWKKMVLLQSLSPIGIVHSTASAVGSNPDKPSSKMISMSVASSSGNVPLGSTPIFTNPLSTPKDMSWDLVRFFSQAKPPTGLRFANPSTFLTEAVSVPSKGVESSISAQHADDSIASMHVIEMDTGIATNLVVDTSNVGADTSGSFRSDKPVSNEGNSTSQTVTNALPTRVHYPSLGVYVYEQLIEAYICIDRRKFDAILQECSELFENDGNLGLVQRVGFALLNRHIYELSRVYGTISLDDLGVEMNLPSHVVHSLLDDLQTKLSWPVRLVPLSSDTSIDSKKSGVIVVFPAELPHPNLDVDNSDVSLTKQLNDLTVMVRLLGGAIAASPKYKSALAAAERRNVNTGTSVLGPMSVELV